MKTISSTFVHSLEREMQIRNYSVATIRNYCDLLTGLEQKMKVPLEEVTTEQFKDYLHFRITQQYISVSLVNMTISAFKVLQTDVFKRDWQPIKVKRPIRTKKLPVVLSQQEIGQLIVSTKNINHRAIIMLAYSSGLRRGEIQKIKPSAIDSKRMQVRVVQGKGKKDRYTILSKKALEMLRDYYKAERPSELLFEAQGKKRQPLSDTTLNNIVKKNAVKAGIKKNISFHTLRHCFATHLLETGVNLRLIQQFLGHVSLKTTSVYLHLTNIDTASIISPLDSMDI